MRVGVEMVLSLVVVALAVQIHFDGGDLLGGHACAKGWGVGNFAGGGFFGTGCGGKSLMHVFFCERIKPLRRASPVLNILMVATDLKRLSVCAALME